MRRDVLVLALTILSCAAANGQIAPNAPADRPQSLDEQRIAAFESAIAPYVAQAKASYPAAKSRFQNGLPEGHAFFITTRLRDSQGRWEQVFVHVTAIQDRTVLGNIASDIQLVSGFEHGQEYSFDEAEMVDWLITRPDGSEEGNVVGKFLDSYRP